MAPSGYATSCDNIYYLICFHLRVSIVLKQELKWKALMPFAEIRAMAISMADRVWMGKLDCCTTSEKRGRTEFFVCVRVSDGTHDVKRVDDDDYDESIVFLFMLGWLIGN